MNVCDVFRVQNENGNYSTSVYESQRQIAGGLAEAP
jgi:hypothetical protein